MQSILILVLACHLMLHNGEASCRNSHGVPICCEGKQSHCYGYTFTNKTSSDQVKIQSKIKSQVHSIRPVKFKKCFCDNACTLTDDCCPDYRVLCHKPIIDCSVSAWGEWSPCSKNCIKGTQFRIRRVTTHPQNGGKACPALTETQTCQLWNCKNRRFGRSHTNQLMRLAPNNEVAYLMPARNDVIQILRRHDIRWDVRRKLYYGRLIKMNMTEQPEPDPYYATYEISFASEGCNKIYSAYIAESMTYQSSSSYADRRRHALPAAWISHEYLLRTGNRVCITCYPAYMRKEIGNRCLGTGMQMMETRWRGVGTPDCHGRFKMVDGPKQKNSCNSLASFLFV